jgi:hypothetical protein
MGRIQRSMLAPRREAVDGLRVGIAPAVAAIRRVLR